MIILTFYVSHMANFTHLVPIISSPDITVSESVGNADVCVMVTNDFEMSFEISYSTVDGTAECKTYSACVYNLMHPL